MKVTIVDRQALGALSPIEVVAYLRASGWIEAHGLEGPLRTWERRLDSGEVVDARVPMHPNWRDYAPLMSQLLEVLSETEARSQLAIFRDIGEATSDVIRFRADSGGRSDGTISLEDSRRLSECAYRTVLAAASATVERKRAFPARKPAKAIEFTDSVRTGQTERGSYVVTLLSRVSPALSTAQAVLPHIESPLSPELPFSRAVTITMARALASLEAATLASVSASSMDAFEAAVADGVSADLCDGIAVLQGSKVISRLDITLSWSSARPGPPDVVRCSSFTPEAFEVLGEAATRLRERAALDGVEISGPVVELTRPGEKLHGEATVAAIVEGERRKVAVELWGDSWKVADEAMAKRWLLVCRGDLHRDSRQSRLKNPRDFRLMPPKSDDDHSAEDGELE